MHLIDLDVAAFDIFDLPPLNEYELYIKNFGRSDTKQVIYRFLCKGTCTLQCASSCFYRKSHFLMSVADLGSK